jgi:PEP-CTERM motif
MRLKSVAGLSLAAGMGLLIGSLSTPASASTVTFPPCSGDTSCSGDISVTLGTPQPSETKIYLNSNSSTTNGSGQIGSQTGLAGTPTVSFTTDVNADFANGFATIDGLPTPHGTYGSLTVSLPSGFLFSDLEFSTNKATDVTFTAMDGASTVGTFSDSKVKSGENNWLVEATNAQLFSEIMLSSTSGFGETKQFEISGLCTVDANSCNPLGPPGGQGGATPLPATFPLFAGGLGVMGLLGWRKKRKGSAPVASTA